MPHNFPYGWFPTVHPVYNTNANYNTNARSYYDALAKNNEELTLLYQAVNRLLDRDIQVQDTKTIDITRVGDWMDNGESSTEYPPTNYDDFITLQCDVKLSTLSEEVATVSLSPREDLFTVSNGLKVKNDGLFTQNLWPVVHALDEKVQSMTDRVDEINVDGAEVIVGGFEQYADNLPLQINQALTKNDILANPSITHLTLVSDLHLRTDYNGFSSKQYFNSIAPIQDVGHLCDGVFYLGDNIDGLSGQATDNSGMIPASNVKYANTQAYKKLMNALVINEPVPTYALIGNHDIGGMPYAWESTHKDMRLEASTLSKLAGHAAYGVHKFVNKQVAVIWLNTMEITYEESIDYECGISTVQLNWLQHQLNTLESNYHILVVGHHQLGSTHMKNGQALIDIFEAFHARDTSKFIGYVHGHMHMDKDWGPDGYFPFNALCLIQAFPSGNQPGTDQQTGFYVLQVDVTNRTAHFKPIGHAALTTTLTY